MALQTTPPISMQDIANEFGLSLPKSLQELAVAAGVSGPPYSLLDFLGLSAVSFDGIFQQKITRAGTDRLGGEISVSNDGSTFVASSEGTSSALVFVKSGSTWSFQAELTGSDTVSGDLFATQLSISDDGNTIIVGASRDDINGIDEGSAYIFVRSGTTWSQQAKLLAADLAQSDRFGGGVSLTDNGNYALIGAFGENTNGSKSGAVYGFVRSGSTWSQVTKITPNDGVGNDQFGSSVSISKNGQYAVIGAGGDDTNRGSLYVYTRSGNTWSQQAKLFAAGGTSEDSLGFAVDINEDGTTIIGAATLYDGAAGDNEGSAYIFVRSGTTWSQQAQLFPANRQPSRLYAFDVSITNDGNYVLVGQYLGDSTASIAGVAYVYERIGTTWNQAYELIANDAEGSDFFGIGHDISGDGGVVVVGASREDSAATDAGAVYIYE